MGSFHQLALSPEGPIMRGATGAGHAVRVARELTVAHLVAGLGLQVPVPSVLDGPTGDAAMTAILISRTPGVDGPDRDFDAALGQSYGDLLADLGRAEVSPRLSLSLPQPRAWCGGAEWPHLVHLVTAALPADLRRLADDLVVAVLDSEVEGERRFVHGDFGPHNILWEGGRPASLIDFDHATTGDPAIDVAPLIGCYGATAVASIVESQLVERAMVHRATLSLQVACAADLTGQFDLREHALGNFVRRVAADTLYDPGGRRPSKRG